MTRHRRPVSLLAALLLAVPTTLALAQDAPAPADRVAAANGADAAEAAARPKIQPPPYASPEEVFAAAKAVFNAGDWRTFLEVVSPQRRDELIGEMAVGLARLAEQPKADERVVALVKTYLPEDFEPMEVLMGSDDPNWTLVATGT